MRTESDFADSMYLLCERARTDKLIAASIQWAERIMEKIDVGRD